MKESGKTKTLIIALFVLGLLTFSTIFTQSAHAAEVHNTVEEINSVNNHYYSIEGLAIAVVYDETTELTRGSGESIANSLSLMSPNVYGIPVSSINQMNKMFSQNTFNIIIYVFQTDYNGILVQKGANQVRYTWDHFLSTIMIQKAAHHIFSMGNTVQLLDRVKNLRVYGSGEEKVDAHHQFVYALWTLSEILETKYGRKEAKFAEAIKMETLEYFSRNFNELVAGAVEPTSQLGIEHPDTIAAREKAFFDEHPANVTRLARPGFVADQSIMRDVHPHSGEVRNTGYVMDLFPIKAATGSDFILQLLPEDSGLRGPIGGIVDALLSLLFEFIGGVIGLSTETVEALANAIIKIPQFIGAIKDPDASKIKDFLDTLKPMLPLPEDAFPYFDLVIDALFLLRGDANDIVNFITGAIDLLVPTEWNIGGIKAVDVIKEVFTLGAGVFDKINNGGNVVDIILSALNEQIVANLTATFIGDGSVFSMNSGQVNTAVSYISGFTGLIINLISTNDFSSLVNDYGPQLFSTAISSLGISEANSKTLMKGFSAVLVATGIMKGTTLQDIIIDIIADVSGLDVDSLVAPVSDLLQKVSNAIDSGQSDVNAFLSSLDSLDGLGLNANILSAIKKMSAIAVAVASPSFNLNSATSLAGMIGDLLAGLGIVDSGDVNTVKTILNGVTGIIAFIKNPPDLKKILSDLLPSTNDISKLIPDLVKFLLNLVNPSAVPLTTFDNIGFNTMGLQTDAVSSDLVNTASEAITLILQVITKGGENSIESMLQTLLQAGVFVVGQFVDTDLTAYVELFKAIFGQVLGISSDAPTLDGIMDAIGGIFPSYQSEIKSLVGFILGIKDIFQGGFKTIMSQLTQWLTGQIFDLIGSLTGEIGSVLGQETWDVLDIDIPIGIGGFSLFTIKLVLGLSPGFEFNSEKFADMIFDLVFKGVSIFTEGADFGTILREAFSFFSIIPIFEARFELSDFGTGESSFISFLLSTLGLELSIEGFGFFKLQLFSFQNGVFNFDDFFKVVEWGFGFSITISKTLTLLDFITGGVGGGLNAIGKYIGLDAISITIAFTIGFEIIKRAATADKPETGTMTITFGIAFTVSLGINILIAKLVLTGTLEIVLTLLQDLVAPTPLRVFISIQLIITVTIGFLFWDWDFDFKWSPSGFAPPLGKEITSPSPQDAVEKGALGADSDKDGLSDEYENKTPGLNPNSEDSDGDGLTDKLETQTLGTDAANKDTDGDGLDDNVELNLKTNPLQADTDFDGLNDYEENVIYGTDPNNQDTDQDGLIDHYEVTHAWNMTGITPSVSNIQIGGEFLNDHTDPLNPDTDGDGLLDGEEGERGIYYGPDLYGSEEDLGYTPDPPLFYNGGYTHPLDNDTDDDSYWQLYDGSIAPVEIPFLMDMSDLAEITGFSVIFIDPLTGEPEPERLVRTNPTNPDSDGDTGVTSDERENPPFGLFLNSDGYELTRDPPTDPLDGDSDDDGLIDGLEGTLRPDSNHTNALNPDTDGDGLGDLQEFQLGTDPRRVDTDLDGVPDGEEFFRYHTNPFLIDTDADGLEDGEELYFYHSNPLVWDSDNDGLNDFEEVWIYFSNPVDEDSDNDGVDDWEEIILYYTDPFDADSDDDGLFDGEEINGLLYYSENGTEYLIFTDPLKWDTDGDSLLTLDQDGEISQSMSDYDEWILGTDPTRSDSDQDGIYDGWEIWLGKGKIPDFDPLRLDPLNNDTDGDSLMDGQEMFVGNVTTLLYPYLGFVPVFPYNTRPDNNDTDGDTLNDWLEISSSYNAASNDTDGDTIADNIELILGTNVLKNDTDGDGVIDPLETLGWGPNNDTITDPLNSDTDGDLLPDGAEWEVYNQDPTNGDMNGNRIKDGMEVDSDGDGLFDGEEYYIYRTVESPHGGGPYNPDSDRDGLFDGLEVYETYTDPALWDTDNDTYSDGLEFYCETNPNDNSTSESEIQQCFAGLIRIAILSPVPTTYFTNEIPVIVFDSTGDVTKMEYRYKVSNQTDWSTSVPMVKQGFDNHTWEGAYLNLPTVSGVYDLEVTAEINGTDIITRRITFTLEINLEGLNIIKPEGKTYEFSQFDDVKLPIEVEAGLVYSSVWYRIKRGNGDLLTPDNITLTAGADRVFKTTQSFPDEDGTKTYAIEVFGEKTNGDIFLVAQVFKIKTPTLLETAAPVAIGVTVVTVTVVAVRQGVFKNPFKKGGNN